MDYSTTYGYWRVIARHCRYTIPDNLPRPEYIGDKPCPEDRLEEVTIGQLIEMGEAQGPDTDYRICEIMLGYDKQQTDECRAVEVVPFISWIGRQIKSINKLFEGISHKPTAKEKQAGIEKLQFGLFGMLDWYAKRMGITDHDEVLNVPWMRIYKCMEMDNLVQQYEKRYNEIALREARRKKR